MQAVGIDYLRKPGSEQERKKLSKKGQQHLANMCSRQRPVFTAEGRSWGGQEMRMCETNNRPLCFLSDVRLLRSGHLFPREKTVNSVETVEKCIYYGPGSDLWGNLPKVTREPGTLDTGAAWPQSPPFPPRCPTLQWRPGLFDNHPHSHLVLYKLNKKRYWHWITHVAFTLNF